MQGLCQVRNFYMNLMVSQNSLLDFALQCTELLTQWYANKSSNECFYIN